MNVIHMPQIVGFIADHMFPIMPLPDTSFPCGLAHIRTSFGFG